MESHDAVIHHVGVPVFPIFLNGVFRVVAVDQQKINRRIPGFRRFLAEQSIQ